MTSEWGSETWQLERRSPTTMEVLAKGVLIHTKAEAAERIPLLLQQDADVRFVRVVPREAVRFSDGWLYCGEHEHWSPCIDNKHAHAKQYLDQVIVAGESDPVHPAWVRSLRVQCVEAGVAFFFEGWGDWVPTSIEQEDGRFFFHGTPAGPFYFAAVGKEMSGRELDGRTWGEEP